MNVEFGICPDNQIEDFRKTVQRAHSIEASGFDYIWLGDHLLPFQHSKGHNRSVMVEIAAYLERTDEITVGAQVLAPIGLRRQPVDVALDLATLALLHPGRVALTVGTGEAMNETNATGLWPEPGERVARCVESIEVIYRCWTEDDYFRHDGEYFHSFFYLYTKPEPPVSLTCAANGPKMAYYAGRLTDGICSVGVSPDQYRETILPAFAEGVGESGRDPSDLQRMIWIPVSYHPSRERAMASSRLEAGVLVPGVVDNILDPREMERLSARVDEDRIVEASCVATSPEEIVEFFGRFLEAGANHIIWGDLSPEADLVPEVATVVIDQLRAT